LPHLRLIVLMGTKVKSPKPAKPNLGELIIDQWHPTGCCTIHVPIVASKWGYLWKISQWKDQYRLLKLKRKDSSITDVKITISAAQAQELIDTLNLTQYPSPIFSSSSVWVSE
jgi:hypothetical protein